MKCLRCPGDLSVLRTYGVDGVGTTQDRVCMDCGYRCTTVTIELKQKISAYRARRILSDLELVQRQERETESEGKK